MDEIRTFECDRLGDGRADYSHCEHSPAVPGRAHDLTGARTYRIIRICERKGVPTLAERAYMGAVPWATTPLRRPLAET